MALHLNILITILTLQENLRKIQDQAALHVIFPTLKALALNLLFTCSKLWNSLSHNIQCITDKFIFKKMIKGILWNRLRSAHISEYIFYQ